MIVRLADLVALRQDEEHPNRLSSDDLSNMFDEFLVRFEAMQMNQNRTINEFIDALEEIVDAVLSIRPKKLLDPKIIHHPLLHFLHQVFLGKLEKSCQSSKRVTFQEMDILLKSVLIFIHAAEQAPTRESIEDHQRKQHLDMTKRFLYVVRDQIDDIILNRQSTIHCPNIFILGLFAIKLIKQYPFYYRLGNHQRYTGNRE